jgi:hypothetical protein
MELKNGKQIMIKNQFFKTEVEERKYMTIFTQQLNLINKL